MIGTIKNNVQSAQLPVCLLTFISSRSKHAIDEHCHLPKRWTRKNEWKEPATESRAQSLPARKPKLLSAYEIHAAEYQMVRLFSNKQSHKVEEIELRSEMQHKDEQIQRV